MHPSVSIIITCHFKERYLDKAYFSAKGQDYPGDIDIVVVHDGCDNGKNRGTAVARNLGLIQARGEYMLFLDADDMLPQNYLSALMKNAELKVIVGCPVQFISGTTLARFDAPDGEGSYTLDDLRSCMPIPVSAIFHCSAIAAVGEVDCSDPFTEDWDFWYRLLSNGYTYWHSHETELLKNNESFSKTLRNVENRKETIRRINRKYGVDLSMDVIY